MSRSTGPDTPTAAIVAPDGSSTGALTDAKGDLTDQIVVVSSLFIILLLTLGALLSASKLQKHLGVTGMHVVGRIMGVLLSALAVQFILDGIAQSGLVST